MAAGESRIFHFLDMTAAINNAAHWRNIGMKVAIGHDEFNDEWYVRTNELEAVA